MSAAVDQFINELRAAPAFAEHAQSIADCFDALDHEADGSADAAGLYEALHWVVRHPQHTLYERIDMIHRLINLKGRQVGTPRRLTGW
jgi:hypothetical protein